MEMPTSRSQPGVQARHGGVLVDEVRRLEHAVGVRRLGHGVDQGGVDEAGWGQRVGHEDDQADRPGDEHGVPEPQELAAVQAGEPDHGGDDDRPVAPDVDPVRGVWRLAELTNGAWTSASTSRRRPCSNATTSRACAKATPGVAAVSPRTWK